MRRLLFVLIVASLGCSSSSQPAAIADLSERVARMERELAAERERRAVAERNTERLQQAAATAAVTMSADAEVEQKAAIEEEHKRTQREIDLLDSHTKRKIKGIQSVIASRTIDPLSDDDVRFVWSHARFFSFYREQFLFRLNQIADRRNAVAYAKSLGATDPGKIARMKLALALLEDNEVMIANGCARMIEQRNFAELNDDWRAFIKNNSDLFPQP